MKKQFFYSKKDGEYVGGTNSGQACPSGCGVTEIKPENSGQFYDEKAEVWLDCEHVAVSYKHSKRDADYLAKVAAYDLNKTKLALRFVKNTAKKAMLESRLASLSA